MNTTKRKASRPLPGRDATCNQDGDPNWPSKTGNPSGPGRDNNPGPGDDEDDE